MVKPQPSKLAIRVRFPLPAPNSTISQKKRMNMKATLSSALIACVAVFTSSLQAEEADCLKVANLVKKQIEADADNILKLSLIHI